MPAIDKAKILIMATDGYEQSELMRPLLDLRDMGATVHVASPANTREEGFVRGWDHKDWGGVVVVDKTLDQVSADDYDALVLPGGQMNPDILRMDATAMTIIKSFLASGKPVAAICHAPWLLIEAGAAKGRQMTSWPSLKTDMTNAGAKWVDSAVVTDEGIITSRKPEDLDAFIAKIVEEVAEGVHQRKAA